MMHARFPMNRLALGVSLLLGVASAAVAGVTDQNLLDAGVKDNKSVLTWGIDYQGTRYSPLKQINADTIKDLVPAWTFSYGDEKQRGQEAQPLVYNGKIFVTASYSRIYAVDAKTGKKLWVYEHRLPDGILPCCDVINRGAALYGDLVIYSTLDAQLVALNQETGKVVWREKMDNYKDGYSNSAAPIVVKGLVITGVSGGEFGVVGRVDARDALTGKLVWTRPVIEGHMGYTFKDGQKTEAGLTGETGKTWPGDLWQTGGGATWLGGYYDPETDSVLIGTGNPAPWNAHTRPGDNLYSASSLAIDPSTGKIKWHYQTTPNDGWDFDGVNEVVSFDLDGTKAAATADRNGFFYVLNRENGKFIRGFPFVEKITWASGLDENGRPKFVADNRPGDPKDAKDGKQGKSVFAVPSFLGGKNQQPMAYSPDTKLFYVPANEWGMDIHNEPVTYKKGAAYLGAGFTIKRIFEDHIGSLKAIDPASGKIVWQVNNNAPLWGGVLTTGGGLVVYGTPEGDLKIVDDKTGKELWHFNTGSGIVAPPITWEQDGEQMISVISGWGGAVPLWGGEVAKTIQHLNQGGMVWTFKLPKKTASN